MAGTQIGGLKAAETNKKKHGSDFYAKIGAQGGRVGRTGGFYANPELARIAGAKGGKISKRRSSKSVKIEESLITTQEVRLTMLQKLFSKLKGA